MDTGVSKRDKVVERVRAMIRKANDAGSTHEETMSLMDKVSQLTADYLIEEHELTGPESSKISLTGGKLPVQGSMAYMMLCCELGDMFGCIVAFSRNHENIVLSARPVIAIAYKDMLDYLTEQIVKTCKEAGPLGETTQFIDGVCRTICMKIERQRAGMADRMLPVIQEQKEAEEVLMAATDVEMRETKTPEVSLLGIYGMIAGESVEINKKL